MMRRLILVGAGHAHAQVLKAWASAPRSDVELVLVSPHALAPYSGMVPGWLSGVYRYDEIVIDFVQLAARAGARWICAEIDSMDPDRQSISLSNGQSLGYDWLSLNVGSTLLPPTDAPCAQMLPMRPLADLYQRYETLLSHWRSEAGDQPLRVLAVGGGAAGFESLLAVLRRLRQERPDRVVQGLLMTSGSRVLPDYPARVQRVALRTLYDAGVDVQVNTVWHDSRDQGSDWILWATGAQSHAWQRDPARRGALAVSAEGYVLIDAQLRSVSHPNIFAVGDCAHWTPALPKAGVYAVRMGPVLSYNLHAVLNRSSLRNYQPQRRFLSLLATADGRAIASRGCWTWSGRWAWYLKNDIDRRFIRRFSAADLFPRLT
ncbi:MAG: FAD-dependent oxidoreductase [Burkholderiales bacterium]